MQNMAGTTATLKALVLLDLMLHFGLAVPDVLKRHIAIIFRG
jgi:hypothetical protein